MAFVLQASDEAMVTKLDYCVNCGAWAAHWEYPGFAAETKAEICISCATTYVQLNEKEW